MKIAIPTDDKTLQSAVCVSFGRAPYFLIYDTDTKSAVYIDNTAAEAPTGAGTKAAQIVVDAHADCLITVRCGENSAQVLKAAEIKIFKTSAKDAAANLSAFEHGELAEMTKFHAGFHGIQ